MVWSTRLLALLWTVAVCADSLPDALAEAHRLLRKDQVAAAAALMRDIARTGESAAVLEVLGEIHFRQGDVAAAQVDFEKSAALDANMARAWWGLGRVSDCNSLHHTAENYYRQAYDLAPDDPDIAMSHAHFLKGRERIAALQRYLELAVNYAEPERLEDVRKDIAIREQVGDRELNRLTSPYQRTAIPLGILPSDGGNVRGFGLMVSINGGRPLNLLLDTGASGILLRSKAARKVGATELAETSVRGIGDEGGRSHGAIAREVRIGGAVFADYLLDVAGRKSIYGEDGIIGTDVFAEFLVTLDFRQRKLVLDPLPGGRPVRQRTYDRAALPALKDFTPVFRVDHLLLVETTIAETKPVLFILDTGASSTMISTQAAFRATKVHLDSGTRLRGVSGNVQKVWRTDDFVMQFAGFHQKNRNTIALDLEQLSKDAGIELSGLLGLPLLRAFILSLDYRDGLVKFQYAVP
ncbi:MAG TPA: aspartyl protease family protein [Bryobacteraceae bacterium]|nr:aspartyl protease family protein [Bryobacteraceae bacterium]